MVHVRPRRGSDRDSGVCWRGRVRRTGTGSRPARSARGRSNNDVPPQKRTREDVAGIGSPDSGQQTAGSVARVAEAGSARPRKRGHLRRTRQRRTPGVADHASVGPQQRGAELGHTPTRTQRAKHRARCRTPPRAGPVRAGRNGLRPMPEGGLPPDPRPGPSRRHAR